MHPGNPSTPKDEKTAVRSPLRFPVVGIGASAGGLEAIIELLENLPADCGMAFVVILHLGPESDSHAAEVLQRSTAMPVEKVVEPTLIEAGHVYVIPPNSELSMVDGHLAVSDAAPAHGTRVAIDIFFRSLAQAQQERAFGVVLSGAGSDGAAGIARVKEQGGVTIAQHPASAHHDGMPLAAIATGAIDFILPPEEIGPKLVALWKTARAIELPPDDGKESTLLPAGHVDTSAAEAALQKIIAVLRVHTGHDFRHYKRPTILRRIERRMQVRGATTLPAYLEVLENDADEHTALLRDMLIGVTNFFRDRDAFDTLATQALAGLVASKPDGEPVRAWVPACSTGEEAYSIAILMAEQAMKAGKPPKIQVFASDIDEAAISTARNALYPTAIVADVSPDRLQQFFTKEDKHYRIRKAIRDCVLFAPHNILRDPPFSKLDLISCRNLLIYLNREMQSHILEMFHFSLNPGGVLFLGSAESADVASNLFAPLSKKHHIYQARALSRGRYRPSLPSHPALRQNMQGTDQARAKRQFSFAEVHQRVLAQYAPPSVLVNHDSDIVYISDRAGRFLRHIGGEPSRNLVALVHPELRVELRTALYQAMRSGQSVEARRVKLVLEQKSYFVNMTVRPFHDEDAQADLVLVQFDAVEQTMSPDTDTADTQNHGALAHLEEELQRTKEQLQETIEQSEVSNEELRASNEELQAINEELRSASEELETSKEELQSVNEELSTVNYQLKTKVEETSKVNDDLNNLIASADIATIFVDRTMRIKRYTPHASEIFNIIPTDIGRSLLDITHRLSYPELTDDTATTFETLRPVERAVQSTERRHYIVRILPYRTTEDHIEGAVMTFFDITSRREAEERLRAGEERLRLVNENMTDCAIVTLDAAGRITSWSRGAEYLYGYTEGDVLGKDGSLMDAPEPGSQNRFAEELRRAQEQGRIESQAWNQRKDGTRFFAAGVLAVLKENGQDRYLRIVRAAKDEPKQAG